MISSSPKDECQAHGSMIGNGDSCGAYTNCRCSRGQPSRKRIVRNRILFCLRGVNQSRIFQSGRESVNHVLVYDIRPLNQRGIGDMSTTPQYKVFIGSSREAKLIAQALQHELRDVAASELWSQGLFRVGTVVLDDLVQVANGYDFGVFVFAPDDILKMREKQYSAVRDNVVFELGVFVGRLGPERCFFVVPEADDQLHLPSDLSGIIPAKYDSENTNPQVAVASAVFQISSAFRVLGPLKNRRGVLYDSQHDPNSKFLQGKTSYIYKDDKRIGNRADGSLVFGPDGLLTIERRNPDGRFEIHVRPEGPKRPSFARVFDPLPLRCLRVNCEVLGEGGVRKLRFVAKDEENDRWLAHETRRVEPGEWRVIEFYLWIDPTKDFLFRIDEEELTMPGRLMIRRLLIDETEK